MKRLAEALIIIGITLLLLVAIVRNAWERMEERSKHRPKAALETNKWDDDYVMQSLTARSNAMYFGKPPEGFQIVCDGSGRYAPRETWPEISDKAGLVWSWSFYVRSNQQEAIVAAWRVKEVLEDRSANNPKPAPPPINWKPCE